jgi:hypothetical protein
VRTLLFWLACTVSVFGQAPVPASFFGMHVAEDHSYSSEPTLSPVVVGALGKPVATNWSYLETARGTYNFSNLDNAIQNFAIPNNVSIFYAHSYVPSWATSDTSSCFTSVYCSAPPSDLNTSAPCQGVLAGTTTTDCQWKEFLTTLVQRYKSTGVQSGCTSSNPQCHGVIQMYEGWNEPPYPGWPTPMTTADFVTFETDFYNTVKANDPNAQVHSPAFIIGTEYPGYATFMTDFFAAGGLTTYDGYDFHFSEATPENEIALINQFKSILSSAGVSNPTIWATEAGRWPDTCPDAPTASITNISIASNVLTVTVSPANAASANFAPGFQASFSGLANATFLNGQTVTVSAVTSTTITAPFTHANYSASGSGTVTANVPTALEQAWIGRIEPIYWANGITRHYWFAYDGCGTISNQPTAQTLTPAGIAYGTIESWMTGAVMGTLTQSPSGSASVNNATFSATLTTNGVFTSMLAWNSGGSGSFPVSNNYIAYYDITGSLHPVASNAVSLTTSPVLIQPLNALTSVDPGIQVF